MKLVYHSGTIVPEKSRFCLDVIVDKDFGGTGRTKYMIHSGYIDMTYTYGIAGDQHPILMLCEPSDGTCTTILRYCPLCGEKIEVELLVERDTN